MLLSASFHPLCYAFSSRCSAFPTYELLLHIVMSESTKEDRPFFFHADFCYIYGSNIFTTGAGAQVPD